MRRIRIELLVTEAEAEHLADTLEVGRDPEADENVAQLPFDVCDAIREQLHLAPTDGSTVTLQFQSESIAEEVERLKPVARIDRYANLSTAHVTKEVAAVLDAGEDAAPEWRQQLIMMARSYGWFIRVPEPQDPANSSDMPGCLRACFDVARADGAAWILFDCDEESNGALPTYSW